jgi:hypothetical protein
MAISDKLRDWNPKEGWVRQDSARDFIDRYINAETSVICVGSPVFSENTEIGDIRTVGLAQQFGVRSGKQVGRFFEIGSRGNVLVPGRGAGTLAIGRVLFNGPSLLRSLYPGVTNSEVESYFRKPGYNDAFFNLQSELFNDPFGIFFMMYDKSMSLYAGIFFEVCFITSHNWTMGANSNIVAENAGIMYQETKQIDPGEVAA